MEGEIELAEFGLTVDRVIQAAENDAKLGPTMERRTSREAKLRSLEWFGDQGHPIPVEQTGSVYDRRGVIDVGPHASEVVVDEPLPESVRLPALEDDEPATHEVKGEPGQPRVLVTKDTLFEIFRQSPTCSASTSAVRAQRWRRSTPAVLPRMGANWARTSSSTTRSRATSAYAKTSVFRAISS
ncbi:MAG: hypothetical protein ACRDNP_06160 [Gaiellaceae bacterium]